VLRHIAEKVPVDAARVEILKAVAVLRAGTDRAARSFLLMHARIPRFRDPIVFLRVSASNTVVALSAVLGACR
jgi:hypothetical protein